MKQRCLMIGAGGMARGWIQNFWTPFQDRMEFAGLVDVNRAVLDEMGDFLGLPATARFTDVREAFAQAEADFCCIVTPPQFHQQAVELACAQGMDILSEKPISDTWEGCRAIYQAVRQAGVKMMVTQNYRYNPTILTLKKAVAELGAVNYVVGRYSQDYRVRGSWGAAFRHELPHSLIVEGGVHHFDQIRNLSDANCRFVTGFEWHPGQKRGDNAKWKGSDSFDGEPCCLFVMEMENGSFAHYEGNNLETGKLNGWHHEYYRVECEGGVAILDSDLVVRVDKRGPNNLVISHEVTLETPRFPGHLQMPAQFLDWREGGPIPPTAIEDNMQSSALTFAAIKASETRCAVDVQQMVREATA